MKFNGKDVQCLLMRDLEGGHYIRIYDKKYEDGFKDFNILYDDLKIQVLDDDAIFDEEKEVVDIDWESIMNRRKESKAE